MSDNEKNTVLIVDDEPANLSILTDCLASVGYNVSVAEDGETAVKRVESEKPDIILLDVRMPGMDGFETCLYLKQRDATKDIPVIFLTVASEPSDKIQGFLVGGIDYITKPFQVEEVLARVTTHMTVQNLQRDLGEQNRKLQEEYTARIEEEKMRRELVTKIRQAQKLESLCTLAGGLAHDFNNLLQGIVGYAGLALGVIPGDSPAYRSLEQIEKTALRATELTNQMLAFSGKGAFLLKPLNLSKLVRDMSRIIKASISKKANIQLDLQNKLPRIEGDDSQIRQVIMNMVINASEALEGKSGTITVSTGLMECDSRFFYDSCLPEEMPAGEYVFLEVKDTGCGMDSETVGKVFDPFFSTKFTGRGLGLAALSGIVRGHKGAVKIESSPGEGTAFRIFFPVCRTEPTEVHEARKPVKPWKGSGTVLLVDDEEIIRDVASEMLELLGLTVLTAKDGREAVEIYRKRGKEIRLVILDLKMPRMGGEEAFEEIRRLNPEAVVVLSSGYNEKEFDGNVVFKGLAGFIQKPYRLDTLSEKLWEVLGEELPE